MIIGMREIFSFLNLVLLIHCLIRFAQLNNEGKIIFFDVAPGEAKETFIKYEFRGKIHEVVIADSDELLLPQRLHIKE